MAFGPSEEIVAWDLEVDPIRGTTARPTTARAMEDGQGYRMGNDSKTIPSQILPALRDMSSFESWLTVLEAHRPR